MRRVNIQAAFLGEGGESDTGDDEGLALAVRGGEVIVVVPAGTSDERAIGSATTVRGSLRLETGRVLLFEIHDGAVGAFFEDEPAALFDRREQTPGDGLSTLTAQPSTSASFGGAAALKDAAAAARDVMTADVVSVSPATSVDEAARLIAFHRFSGMPVCEEGRVVGVVSEADLIGKSGATVKDVMTTAVVTVTEEAGLEEVTGLLLKNSIRRAPVVGPDGSLKGVVSRGDILRWATTRLPAP